MYICKHYLVPVCGVSECHDDPGIRLDVMNVVTIDNTGSIFTPNVLYRVVSNAPHVLR